MLGSKGSHAALPAHPARGPSLQVPEGVPHGAVPALRATQMHPAPALHLLPLALREPATPALHPPSGRHVQLQPRRLLHQVRRGHRPLPGGRRVSDPTQPARRVAPCLLGHSPSEWAGRSPGSQPEAAFGGDCCSPAPLLRPGPGLRGRPPPSSAFEEPHTGLLLRRRATSAPRWLPGPPVLVPCK